MVILQDKGVYSRVSLPSNIGIIDIGVAAELEDEGQADISVFRPLHDLATDLPCVRVAAQQLAHQMRTRWPSMSWFMMSLRRPTDQFDDFGREVISQLIQGSWTRLRCQLDERGSCRPAMTTLHGCK